MLPCLQQPLEMRYSLGSALTFLARLLTPDRDEILVLLSDRTERLSAPGQCQSDREQHHARGHLRNREQLAHARFGQSAGGPLARAQGIRQVAPHKEQPKQSHSCAALQHRADHSAQQTTQHNGMQG